MSKEPILKVKDLGISFSQYTNGLVRRDLNVIRNLDIELYEGEILAVVGSSGSGKSLLAHAILGILPDNACTQGDIIYKGEILDEKRKEKVCFNKNHTLCREKKIHAFFGNGFFGFVGNPVADAYVVYSQYYKKCDLEWKCKLHHDKRKYSICGNISLCRTWFICFGRNFFTPFCI